MLEQTAACGGFLLKGLGHLTTNRSIQRSSRGPKRNYFTERYFADEAEAKLWMIENQLGRRNLTTAGELRLREARYALLAKEADKRIKAGKKLNPSPIWGEGLEKGKASEILSKESGIGRGTIERYNYVAKNIDDEDLNKLCNGELDDDGIKMSIGKTPSDPILNYLCL